MTAKEFAVDSQTDIEALLHHFTKAYQCSEKPPRRMNEFYYDTFDWRLFNKGFLLKRRGKYFYLTSRDGGVLLKEPGIAEKHFFAGDIAEGPLQKKIKSVAGIRVLSEVMFLRRRSRQFNLLNKDRKTVVRLFQEQGRVDENGEEKSVSPVLRIVKVRGYEKPYANAIQLALKGGLHELADSQSSFQRALAAIGRKPGDYSSGFEVSLEDDATVEQVFNRVCLPLADTMENNVPGLLEDLDPEFLHDFRVACRRTRSFLSHFKKSFPPENIALCKQELKWLGTMTGPVRDLDVYLLMKDEFTSMLPVELHAGLDQFFVDLGTIRAGKFEEMKNALGSARYREFISWWQLFLQHNGHIDQQPKDGGVQCRPLAVKKIRKGLKKILKDGSTLNSSSTDKDFHRLRIQGKKLRYLIEFFRSFFDTGEIEYFRKQLKRLQDMLGEFNDTSVQLEMLVEYQGQLTGRNKRSIAIAAAIGGLITHLTAEHAAIRNKFTEVFSEFASRDNMARFYAVFV